MKKLKVKVCGMRNVLNIAEIAMLNPDYMGFIFYERSPRFAGDLNQAILNVLSPETSSVGVFVDAKFDYVTDLAEHYRLKVLQLHGDETPEYCAELKAKYNCKMIKAFRVNSKDDFPKMLDYEQICDYFLFDAKTELYGGSGEKFDHNLMNGYKGKTPFFLSGGIALQDAESILANRHELCIGVDINSRFEISPGIKNVEQVKQFIDFFRTNTKCTK
jgi:phosphoribosylanthranilate isomerase